MSTDVCIENLRHIYDAIVHFQKRNHSLPRWLSDLYPEYLKDRQLLICHNVKPGIQLPGGDPRMSCSYAYQLQPTLLKEISTQSMRQWKIEQIQRFGTIVPIVRCWHHLDELNNKVLNLSYDGKVYMSATSWENEIAAIRKQVSCSLSPDSVLSYPFQWRISSLLHRNYKGRSTRKKHKNQIPS
jgi:hypothetical protein